MDEPSAALERPRDGAAARDHPLARPRGDHDHPDLPLPARGARPRGRGDRAARRPRDPYVAGVGRDRVVARRGDARAPAYLGVPAAGRRLRPTRRSCSRCAACGRPGSTRRASTCAPARSSASPASSARAGPSSRGRVFGAARLEAGTVVLGDGAARRPEPAAQPRRRARDDPGVAQGRRPDLRPVVDRERDAVAARGAQRARRRAPARPSAAARARCSSAAACAAPATRRPSARSPGGNQQKVLFARDALLRAARPDRGRADARRRRRRQARDLRLPRRARRRRPRRGR